MNIVQVYKQFPTQGDCIKHLEKVRWSNKPVCPYCSSENASVVKNENRYHCNSCNTSYSVTVNTIFHKTKVDFQKWFVAITLVLNAKKGISARQLSRDLGVNKDTAWSMLMRIRKAFVETGAELLEGIIECDETYVGGKNKNRHADKKVPHSQGRSSKDKTAVFGVLQRDGKVVAQTVSDVSAKSLQGVIKKNVKEGSTIMTDEWKSYNGLSLMYGHHIVKHAMKEYVNGTCHTNTLEGFWSLLKRGVIGQFHYVTPKHLNKYIDEFCFRYNNRKTENLFAIVLDRSLSVR